MLNEILNEGFEYLDKRQRLHAIKLFESDIETTQDPEEKATLNYYLGIARLALALDYDKEAEHYIYEREEVAEMFASYTEANLKNLLQTAASAFALATVPDKKPCTGLDFISQTYLPYLQSTTDKLFKDKNFSGDEYDKLELFFLLKFDMQQKIESKKFSAALRQDLQKLLDSGNDIFYFSEAEINKLISIHAKHKKIEYDIDHRLLGLMGVPRFSCYLPLMIEHNLMHLQGTLKLRGLIRRMPSVADDLFMQLNSIPFMGFTAHTLNILLSNEKCGESIKKILEYISKYRYIRIHTATYEYLLNQLPHPTLTDEEYAWYSEVFYKINDASETYKEKALRITSSINVLALINFIDNRHLSRNLAGVKELCSQVEFKFGLEIYAGLINIIFSNKKLHPHFLSILSWVPRLSKDSMTELQNHLAQDDWDSLQAFISHASEQAEHKNQISQPPKALFAKFKNISADVQYPLSTEELEDLEAQFEAVMAHKVITAEEQEACFLRVRGNPPDPATKLLLITIICQRLSGFFEMALYEEQIANALALMNEPKRLAQIKTNDGKSFVIAILAAYFALCGRSVDIISTHQELAIRDALALGKFYQSLGLTFGHNVREENTATDYQPSIIYGTNTNFEFSYLREVTTGKEERKQRPYDVVIVDEVDSMFIDMQSQEAIASLAFHKSFPTDIYPKIWAWLNSTPIAQQTAEFLAKENFMPAGISAAQIKRWIQSAHTAQQLNLDKDYVITPKFRTIKKRLDGKVVTVEDTRVIEVVDYENTGQIVPGCRWQDGLHSFLEVKHGLEVEAETYSSASISHIEFFNKYETLLGMSGTLGTQAIRDELKTLYGVNCYDAPPHRPNRRTADPFVVADDDEAFFQSIMASVADAILHQRALLILCESIRDAKVLYALLKNLYKQIQLYTGEEGQSAANMLALGGVSGMITIATNNAGRGANILASAQTAAAGGLRLILTFKCANFRVEWQAFSRTARKDDPGSYQYILRKKDFSAEELSHGTAEKIIAAWQKNREARSDLESAARIEMHKLLHIKFLTQEIFFSLETEIKLKLITPWALHKAAIQGITNAFLNDRQQSQEDVVTAILTEFFKFWEENVRTLTYYSTNSLVRQAMEVGNAEAVRIFRAFLENRSVAVNKQAASATMTVLVSRQFFSSRPELTRRVLAQNEEISENYYLIVHGKDRDYNSPFVRNHQQEVKAIMADTGTVYYKYRAISRLGLREVRGGGGHSGAMAALSVIKTLHADCIFNNVCTDNVKIDIGEVLTCHSGEYQSSALLEAARAVRRADSRRHEVTNDFKFIIEQIPEHRLIFALDSPDKFGTTARQLIEESDNEILKQFIAKYKAPKYIAWKSTGAMSTLSFYGSLNQKKVIEREQQQFMRFVTILNAMPNVDEYLLVLLNKIIKDKPKNRIQLFLGAVIWSADPKEKDPLLLSLIASLVDNGMNRELLPDKALTDMLSKYRDKLDEESESEEEDEKEDKKEDKKEELADKATVTETVKIEPSASTRSCCRIG